MNSVNKMLISLLTMVFAILTIGTVAIFYEKVEAGYVGVRVNLLGSNKGVDEEVLGVGRYLIGWNEELYKFPTFKQTVSWNGAYSGGAFQFQSKEGLSLSANVSVSYTVNREKVATLFATYRKGIDEITNVYIFNLVRDSLVQSASKRTAESLYGEGKNDFINEVTTHIRNKLQPVGIEIDYIAIVGNVWLPQNVKDAIDEKVKAGQVASQRETEILTAKAEALKEIAKAEGVANSKKAIADGEAYAILKHAEAIKKANDMINKSLTKDLIEYNKIEKWDGKLPTVTGNVVPMLNVNGK